jgi:hypothetical protein
VHGREELEDELADRVHRQRAAGVADRLPGGAERGAEGADAGAERTLVPGDPVEVFLVVRLRPERGGVFAAQGLSTSRNDGTRRW